MTQQEQIDAIERDRKARETALALWLLLLMDRARLNVVRAIRVGADWRPVLSGVLLGDDSLDHAGGVTPLKRAMIDTHKAGARRVGNLLGVEIDDDVSPDLMRQYESRARTQLERIRDSIETMILAALALATDADRIAEDVKQVNAAVANGWGIDSPRQANAESTTAITQAYAVGMNVAYRSPAVAAILGGFRFANPLDDRTTSICLARARNGGVRLPVGDPYWNGNTPPLHWLCRSVLLPLVGNFEVTQNPPLFPLPDPGWGYWAAVA